MYRYKMANILCVAIIWTVSIFAITVRSQELQESGRFLVLYSPKYIKFLNTDAAVRSSDVHKIIASAFGLLIHKELQWKGLLIDDIFHRPKANVLLNIPHYSKYSSQPMKVDTAAEYLLSSDIPYVDIGQLNDLIDGRFIERKPLTIDLSLDNSVVLLQSRYGHLFTSLPTSVSKMKERLGWPDSIVHTFPMGGLNTTKPNHLTLLTELQLIEDVMNTVMANRDWTRHESPDSYSFTISGLENIIGRDGSQSNDAEDAARLISAFLVHLKEKFIQLYKGNVLMEIVTMATRGKEPSIRVARSLKEAKVMDRASEIGLAADYSRDYPIIFNIILWLMIALTLATFAIAHSIWYMDPGRDSIIYRMTSQRMKKDN